MFVILPHGSILATKTWIRGHNRITRRIGITVATLNHFLSGKRTSQAKTLAKSELLSIRRK
jgi:hypothetical protein